MEGRTAPKPEKTQGSKLRKTTKTLRIAVTTKGQLCTLEGDATAQDNTKCLSKALAIKTSLQRETRLEKKADNATAKAILDKMR